MLTLKECSFVIKRLPDDFSASDVCVLCPPTPPLRPFSGDVALCAVAAGDVHDAGILLERSPVATASEYDASPAHLHSDDDGIGGYQLSAEVVGEVLREERPLLFAQTEEVLVRPQRLNVPPHLHNNKKSFLNASCKRPRGQNSVHRYFASTYPGEVAEENVTPLNIGWLDEETCPWCGALFFLEGTKSDGMYRQCCHRGKISVHPFVKPVGEVGALYSPAPNIVPMDFGLRVSP